MLNFEMVLSEDHGLVNVIKAVDWVKPRNNTEFVVENGRLDNSPRFSISSREMNKEFLNSAFERRSKSTCCRFVYKIQHFKK